MASLKTLSLLSIFLLLKITKSDLLSPLFSPLFDDVCKEVECGRGKCQPSLNGTLPFYICECDPGWKQTFSDKDDHQHLKFLPCIVPNFCSWTDCGGGSCDKASPFTYDCRCSEGYFNLFNVSAFPCYKECAIGLDCADLEISITNVYLHTADAIDVSKRCQSSWLEAAGNLALGHNVGIVSGHGCLIWIDSFEEDCVLNWLTLVPNSKTNYGEERVMRKSLKLIYLTQNSTKLLNVVQL